MAANRKETQQSLGSLLETADLSDEERARWVVLQRVPNFLEAIGYLEQHRSAIKVADVEGFWGSQIIFVWDLWESSVKEVLREESKTAFLNFEDLAEKVRRYRDRRIRRERLRELLRAVLPGLPG